MHLIGEQAKKEGEVGSVIKWRVLKNYETCYSAHSFESPSEVPVTKPK